MATGLRAFRRAQLGKETTSGTAVAATQILLPTSLTIDDVMSFHEPAEERLSLSMFHRSQVKGIGPIKIRYDSDLLYEEIVYWLQGAVKGGVAPTQPDVGTDLYTITPVYTATNAQNTYTIEAGDNEQEIEVEYCAVESIDITFGAEEAAKVSV